ncbi:SH3 domain-containing protein [Tissierella creatinophila]|uniref:Beta-N-acetylglucosaminidase n=1 Tax=Tissierella creatinophila DSM 6911 TaxID=1123403 RepID=A0A1U7M5Y3_TISCR|nr:SH3 domain-containing protein [Tissierella creatinophila]OLS02629.1 beta-N-acetylglucosaminidase precursor [Tissierella creatinophila DSM 6911]
MKKTNQTPKRVVALSLATIISLNMSPIVFAQPDIVIPKQAPLAVEMEEVKKEAETEVEKVEEKIEKEVQPLQEEAVEVEKEEVKKEEVKKQEVYNNKYIETKISKSNLQSFEIEGSKVANSPHILKAKANSQNGVLYKFYVKDLSTNKWTVIQDYSEKTTATWTPGKDGEYWYGVHIKDKKSTEAKDAHLYVPITIEKLEKAKLESLELQGSGQVDSTHTIKAAGTSQNGVLYKYYVKDLSTNKWTVIQDYSEKTTATWTPSKKGNYWYGVHIKDKYSKDPVRDTHLYKNITIKPLEPAVVDAFEIEGKLEARSPQVLKANASSPNKALYKFYIKDLSTNKWTVIQDYSEKNTATWIPEKPGNYWYGVHVKDIESKEIIKDNHVYKNVKINPLSPAKLEELTISGGGYEKTNHILKAKASSTNGALYKFYVKDLSTNKWIVIQDYSTKDTATWKPNKIGKYWYGVHVKDKMSTNDKDTHKYTPFTINPPVYYNISNYSDTLSQALDKQMNVSGTKPQTSYNGGWVNATRSQVEQYLDPSRFLQFKPEGDIKPNNTEGTITISSLNVRSGPATTYEIVGKTTQGRVHKILGESGGWYLIDLDGVNGWVSGSYVSFTNSGKSEDKYLISLEITASGLNVRQNPDTVSPVLATVSNGSIYVVLEDKDGWYKINAGGKIGWVSGEFTKLINDVPREMYQFMVLSGQCGVTTSQMNHELRGKGIFEGKGSAFIEGSKKYNVNELYLMAHAFLETGNGTSSLAKGILVSTVDGKPVEPKVVYNMYGIGAVDSNPIKGGTERAYKEGWFTPELAITEGAHWISKNYINNQTYKQDTLYKMKWNPVKPGTHQYATDIAWPLKQTRQINIMMEFCRKIEGVILKFDIPKYR